MLNRSTLTQQIQSAIRDNAKGRISADVIDAAITQACDRMSADFPARLNAALTLVAGVDNYPAPDDCFLFLHSKFGEHTPELASFTPEALPAPVLVGSGVFLFSQAPTDQQIEVLGSEYRYQYSIRYQLLDASGNIPDRANHAVFLLALAYVMESVASSDIIEPIQLHKGLGDMQQPRTAADMHRLLMREYVAEVARLND